MTPRDVEGVLAEIEARAKWAEAGIARGYDDEVYASQADVPRLVKALRWALGSVQREEGYSPGLDKIAAILRGEDERVPAPPSVAPEKRCIVWDSETLRRLRGSPTDRGEGGGGGTP